MLRQYKFLARITFKNVQAKTLSIGEMTFGDVVCPVYVPKYTSKVMVYLHPFEGDHQMVTKASAFGTVQEIDQEWSNVERVTTGT